MWFVPLSCTKQSEINFYDTKPTIWLTNTSKITLPNEVRDDEWYICNIQQTGRPDLLNVYFYESSFLILFYLFLNTFIF